MLQRLYEAARGLYGDVWLQTVQQWLQQGDWFVQVVQNDEGMLLKVW